MLTNLVRMINSVNHPNQYRFLDYKIGFYFGFYSRILSDEFVIVVNLILAMRITLSKRKINAQVSERVRKLPHCIIKEES